MSEDQNLTEDPGPLQETPRSSFNESAKSATVPVNVVENWNKSKKTVKPVNTRSMFQKLTNAFTTRRSKINKLTRGTKEVREDEQNFKIEQHIKKKLGITNETTKRNIREENKAKQNAKNKLYANVLFSNNENDINALSRGTVRPSSSLPPSTFPSLSSPPLPSRYTRNHESIISNKKKILEPTLVRGSTRYTRRQTRRKTRRS